MKSLNSLSSVNSDVTQENSLSSCFRDLPAQSRGFRRDLSKDEVEVCES